MKLPLWGTVFTVIGIIILCYLGWWQLQRLQWKGELLAAIEAEYAVDASNVPILPDDRNDVINFKRGYIEGRYHHDKEVLIQARTYEGAVGYHLLTPFEGLGGFILVNRGWIPIELESDKVMRPAGSIKIIGAVRSLPKVNMFVPDNQPKDDVWYSVDPEGVAQAKGFDGVAANIFYADGDGGVSGQVSYPVATSTKVTLNNNHASYAFFWFSMALVLAVIYVIRFIIPQKTKPQLCG